jgi:GT2 family glycosyltransferase
MLMDVDVVIPVYGSWDITRAALASLARRDTCVRNIIVVDDASPDDTAEQLRAYPGIRPLVLERNGGFSAACNAGATQSTADAILFLNNDTIVTPGAIDALAAALDADASLGAVGAKLTYADGTIQSAACTFMTHLDTWRMYQHLPENLPQANVALDCVYVTGAALLVRSALFRAIGGFDTGYRNGVEDVDLCLKVWRSGHRVRYIPHARILHLEGASRGRGGVDRNWEHFRTRWGDDTLDALPRFRPVDAPHFIVRWRDRTPVDALLRAHIARAFRTCGSVRATFDDRPFSATIEHLRSRIERRGPLTIGYNAGANDIVLEPDSLPLGFFDEVTVRADAPAVIVTDASVPSTRRDEIGRALDSEALTFDCDAFDARDLAALREAPHVVFACTGDPWGFLGGERLAAGAEVVAVRTAPFLAHLPDDVMQAVDLAGVPNGVRAGAAARRELLVRFPAVLLVEHLQERGRAIAGGIPDPHAIEITQAIARELAV